MPAKVDFILGRAGSGKSRKLRYDIAKLTRAGERALLIVHDQFTFESERMLAEELGGLLSVSVLSFTTLAQKVLKETGCNKTFLSSQGRRMLIRKIAEENAGGLSVFARTSKTPGFTEKCDELFTKCKRFCISPEDLTEAAQKLPDDAQLRKKLSDISLLYHKTREFSERMYLDSEDLFSELEKRIPHSFASGSHVFVDSFDRPNKQIYSVMEQLMVHAASVTVTLRKGCASSRDADLFEPDRRAFEKLLSTAKRQGCDIGIEYLPVKGAPWGEERHNAPALSHIERQLFAWHADKFTGSQDSVTVFEASSRVAEAEALACAVQKYIREGYRYRDMAVIVPDTQSYASAIRREFARLQIPFFMDAKRPLQGHPVTELITAAVRCAGHGFRQEDMLRLIKSGFCGLSPDETEIFENFILRYGVRGKLFEQAFPQNDVPPEAASAREKVMVPLLDLKKGLSAPTAAEKARALYAYLVQMGVYEALRQRVDELKAEGRFEAMEENAQVWNIVMELLSQVDRIMGDAAPGTGRFLAILEEGLGAYEVGIIPTTVDQVLIGTVDRTRRGGVRILFAAGCNDGLLPPVRSDDSVIDDAELKKMERLGLTPWMNTKETAEYDRLDIYSAFSKPTDRLWLSYTVSAGKESAARSALVERILRIFPEIKIQSDIASDGKAQNELPYCAEAAVRPLIRQLRSYADSGSPEAVSRELFAYFMNSQAHRQKMDGVLDALFYDPSPPPAGAELSALIYGKVLRGSASRLETFNKCPYMHFLRYGVRAQERQEAKEKPTDEGSFYHEALDAFAKHSADWLLRDEEACFNVMDGIADELSLTYRDGAALESARDRAHMRRMKQVLRSTARAIARQMSPGDYELFGSEIKFGKGEQFVPLALPEPDGTSFEIGGVIDRLDRSRRDQKRIRIVDYKKGGKDFKFAKLSEGIDLQLPLYLAAALRALEGAKAAGLYYMPVKEPVIDEKDEAKREQKLSDALRLTGLTAESAGADKSIVRSPVVTDEQMQAVLNYALTKAADTLRRIRNGEIALKPYRSGTETACRYCDFSDACGFDVRIPSCRHRNVKTLKQAEFFEKLDSVNAEGDPHEKMD